MMLLRPHSCSIPGFEGRYSATADGRIINDRTGHILNPWKQKFYLYVHLFDASGKRTGIAVHRLVLLAFIGPPQEGQCCAHFDGDGFNNALENLRWATPKENMDDQRRHGRLHQGESCSGSKLTNEQVKIVIHSALSEANELARRFQVTRKAILDIHNGKTWRSRCKQQAEGVKP